MYCPHCGKEIPDDSVFCPECGEDVNETGEEFGDESGKKEFAPNDSSSERGSKNTFGGNHNTPVLMTLIIAVAAVVIVFGVLWSRNDEVIRQTVSSDASLTSQNTSSSESKSETSAAETTVTSVPTPTDTPTPTPATEKIIVMPAATPTPTEPETVGGSSDEDEWSEDDTDEMVDIGHGIEAPVSDFIFPYSSYQELTQEDIDDALAGRSIKEKHDMSQMIINEILARYGYTFGGQSETSREAKEKFEDLEWYQEAQQYCPTNDSNDLIQQFNSAEKENVHQVNEWQKANDVYY